MLLHIQTEERITETTFRERYPNTSFPANISADVLAPYGYAILNNSVPDQTATHYPTDSGVENTGGVWSVKYTMMPRDPVPAVVAAELFKNEIIATVQTKLDTFARTRGYDSILSATTYATSSVPKFASEGQYAVSARDTIWAALYEVLADVEAGRRPVPTLAEIDALLPTLTWPV